MMITFGQTVGDPASCLEEVHLKGRSIKSVCTDVNRVSISFDTDNRPFEDCTLLAPKRSEIATGTGSTSDDNGSSTLLGGTAYAQVFGVSTAGTLTLSIRSSSTGAFAGEQLTTCTFATVSSAGAPTGQWVAIAAGTIERYTQAAWTITGSTATFAVALKRY